MSGNDFAGAGVAAGGILYNIFAGNRQRQDMLRQQEFQNNLALNSMSLRVADLKRAGLHPTLAVGSGGVSAPPSSNIPAPQADTSSILQTALLQGQSRLLNAKADLAEADAAKRKVETAQLPDYLAVAMQNATSSARRAEASLFQADSSRILADLARAKNPYEITKLIAESNLTTEQRNVANQNFQRLRAELEHYKSPAGTWIPVGDPTLKTLKEVFADGNLDPASKIARLLLLIFKR